MHIFGAHSRSCSCLCHPPVSALSFVFPVQLLWFSGVCRLQPVWCADISVSEWTLSCLRKGTGGIFLWDWSASPLIARLSLSRSCSRSLHSHVCSHRKPTRISELQFRSRKPAPGSFSAYFCEGKSVPWMDASALRAVIFWSTWRNTN